MSFYGDTSIPAKTRVTRTELATDSELEHMYVSTMVLHSSTTIPLRQLALEAEVK